MIRYSYLLSNDIYTHDVRESTTLWDILLEDGGRCLLNINNILSNVSIISRPEEAEHTHRSREERFVAGKYKTLVSLESAAEKWLDFAVVIFRILMYWRNQ